MADLYAPQGIVARSFSHVDFSAAAPGDVVEIAGDNEVQTSVGAGRPIGRIITLDTHTQLVVVELFSAQVLNKVVGAVAVVAGNKVKAAAGGTVVPGANGDGLSYGIALFGAATGASIDLVVL